MATIDTFTCQGEEPENYIIDKKSIKRDKRLQTDYEDMGAGIWYGIITIFLPPPTTYYLPPTTYHLPDGLVSEVRNKGGKPCISFICPLRQWNLSIVCIDLKKAFKSL